MRIRPVAAGDSLVWTASVPADAGNIAEMAFDVAAERSDRGVTVTGSVSDINVLARTVTVRIPAGALTVGLWQVQARAQTIDSVTTFILCGVLDVTRSLLPMPDGVAVARLVLPSLSVGFSGFGNLAGSVSTLVLPPLGAALSGEGALPTINSEIRVPALAATATGSPLFHATAAAVMPSMALAARAAPLFLTTAALAFPPISAEATGSGLRAQADATVRIGAIMFEGYGSGSIGGGAADARLSNLTASADGGGLTPQATASARIAQPGISATGFGLTPQADATARLIALGASAQGTAQLSTLLGWADDAPLLGWTDDAPLEFEDA